MKRKVKTGSFDIAKHITKLDPAETWDLVLDAMEHLETDLVINMVMLVLDEAGKKKLRTRVIHDLEGVSLTCTLCGSDNIEPSAPSSGGNNECLDCGNYFSLR